MQLCNCVCHSAVKQVSGVQEFSSGGKADQRGGEEVESGRIRRSTKKERENFLQLSTRFFEPLEYLHHGSVVQWWWWLLLLLFLLQQFNITADRV